MANKAELIAKHDIFQGLCKSLSAIIGDSAAQAFIANFQISESSFNFDDISKALSNQFGNSKAGLSHLQRELISKLSDTLQVNSVQSLNDFPDSIAKITNEYKHRIAIKYSLTGIAAAFASSLCCLGPFALLLLGVASASAALSLEKVLFTDYHVILVLAGLASVATVVFLQLRGDKQCNLTGLRKNLGYILVPVATLIVSYAVLNYLIGIFFLGGVMPSMLYP
ncbi:MAG: hypothetical protein ACHQ1H_03715 [Nitrososphaerales archaeon]